MRTLHKESGVPVIAYDRMIQSANVDFLVQADLYATGASQAQHVVNNTKKGATLVLLKGSPTDPNAAVIFGGQMSVLKPRLRELDSRLGSGDYP